MKINEELSPYEKDFYQECSKIKFFCSSLNEIKFQIEFLEKICGKELEIYEKQSSKLLSLLNKFEGDIISYMSEPSNLYSVITDLTSVIGIHFQFLRIGLIDCYKIFQNNIPNITKTLDLFNEELLKKTLSILKETQHKSGSKENINKLLNQTFELVVSNIFKGLIYIHQFFFLYSKAKNDFNMQIKNSSEEKSNNKVISIVINDFSERKFAKEYGIYYEPIHFGNYNYDILLKNESENVVSLCDSYLYYGKFFFKCIEIRKKLITEFKKLINDIVTQSPNNLIEKISHVKEKILGKKNNFKVLGIGTEKSWDLLVQSWNNLYNCLNSFMQFCKDVCTDELKEDSIGRKDEYKNFESEWEKYSKKIVDLRNKYTKYYTNEKKRQIKDNQKEYKIFLEKEKQIKNFLNTQCYDFFNSNVGMIRENEKKKATEIQDLCYRFKKLLKKNNEENIESTKIELENATSIDIYQEVKDIFSKQNNKLQIMDFDNYMDNLKEKILTKIDFGQDNLAKSVKSYLDNYLQNNNEINGFFEQSFSDSIIDSLKELQIEGDGNNNKLDKDNNINDLNSNHSLSFNQKSFSLLKNKLSSKEIILNEVSKNNNNINIIDKESSSNNDKQEKLYIKYKNKNNFLSNINENESFCSVNEEENITNNGNNINNNETNNINENDKTNILNCYYNDPLIKNRLLNRSQKVYEMLTEIHFFDRLNTATKERMETFEKEFKKGMYFRKVEEFENIFINEKDIKSTSPLTLIFHYIFNPKTVIREYPHGKSFFECIFLLRGDYNLDVIYDKYEIDKIPKYFNDFNYVNNLFNNYNKNDLDLFLNQIETWYKTFSFQLNFVHPLKKLMIGPDKITIRDVAILYFISPTDLIVDYHSYGSDFPFADNFVSTSQYRFHCDIKYNKNIGRFVFKTSAMVYNKITLLSESYLEDILKIEANKNNKLELQIHTWEPFRIVVETESKNNEIEADKIFVKHLKNTIFNYNNEKPENFELDKNANSSESESSSSSSSSIEENKNNEKKLKDKKKKKKRKKDKNIMNNDTLYYGILVILGLFTIKTLFGINKGIFSFDNFINFLILISICFVIYKSRQ